MDVGERLREAEGTQPSHWLPFTSPRHKEEEKKNGGQKQKEDGRMGEERAGVAAFRAISKFINKEMEKAL